MLYVIKPFSRDLTGLKKGPIPKYKEFFLSIPNYIRSELNIASED